MAHFEIDYLQLLVACQVAESQGMGWNFPKEAVTSAAIADWCDQHLPKQNRAWFCHNGDQTMSIGGLDNSKELHWMINNHGEIEFSLYDSQYNLLVISLRINLAASVFFALHTSTSVLIKSHLDQIKKTVEIGLAISNRLEWHPLARDVEKADKLIAKLQSALYGMENPGFWIPKENTYIMSPDWKTTVDDNNCFVHNTVRVPMPSPKSAMNAVQLLRNCPGMGIIAAVQQVLSNF